MIVADTNLIVYTVLPGTRAGAASIVREKDADWIAPRLWASEFRNALVKYLRSGTLSLADARQAWPVARGLVRDHEVDPLAALDCAMSRGLSGYDAEFVALAELLDLPLITDDRRVLNACPDVAIGLEQFGGL